MTILDIYLKGRPIKVEKDAWESFADVYIKHFSEKTHWYRIGSSSGKVIYEGRSYAEVFEFFEELPFDKLFSSFQSISENDMKAWKKNDLMMDVDYAVLDMYKEKMNQILFLNESKNQLYTFQKELLPPSQTPYSFNGQDVVFWVYKEMASYSVLYAVPKEVAERLHLLDYHQEEIRRDEPFLKELEPYKIDHGYMYNAE